jgi:hypothetical protein
MCRRPFINVARCLGRLSENLRAGLSRRGRRKQEEDEEEEWNKSKG